MMLVVLIEYIYINTKTSVQKETYLNHFFLILTGSDSMNLISKTCVVWSKSHIIWFDILHLLAACRSTALSFSYIAGMAGIITNMRTVSYTCKIIKSLFKGMQVQSFVSQFL